MSYFTRAVVAGLILATGATAHAATVTSTLDFSVSGQSLFGAGGGAGFNKGSSVNMGIAKVGYSAKASSGTVSSNVKTTVQSSFADMVEMGDAGNVAFNIGVYEGAGAQKLSFSTALGAEAKAYFDIPKFGPFNPPTFYPIKKDYSLDTYGAINNGNSILGKTKTASDAQDIVGAGIPSIPAGVSLEAGITLDATQNSTLSLGALTGYLRATHEDGDVRDYSLSLLNSTAISMDLSRAGEWDLQLYNLDLGNSFDSTFGLAATAFFGYGVGGCGDLSDPDDNFFCLVENYYDESTPSLNLLPITPYALNYNNVTTALGTITVYEEPSEVPLPASLAFVLMGLGGLGVAARRRH